MVKKHDLIDISKGSNTAKPNCWHLKSRLPAWYENIKTNRTQSKHYHLLLKNYRCFMSHLILDLLPFASFHTKAIIGVSSMVWIVNYDSNSSSSTILLPLLTSPPSFSNMLMPIAVMPWIRTSIISSKWAT